MTQTPQPAEPAATRPDVVRATVRRAPRFRAFLTTGALLGALVGLVLVVAAPGGADLVTLLTLTGALGLVGLLAGAVVGVVVDARSRPARQ